MIRVVLDTNILTAAMRSPNGLSFQILELVRQGIVRPVVTTTLFVEYEAVLNRPEQMSAHGLSRDEVDRFLSSFAFLAEGVLIHFRWRPLLPDPNDDMVLEAAVNGRADALVTYNIRDFAREGIRFGLSVLTPADFFRALKP
ncbi:putative toxin-antitoxin system toxin component, PIN family [Azospirillum sp. SYSU D00513]|uniref:putative toxin-antitoxin system toxin component, PIN family n=1 Tax=Azospirillum sp. SYSU D00513 TaxID=2812561 RepID=UPI001A967AEF|nr:putative toxin-antitoxin system toxin component, PIN family [Azospirillum sp. SYSU D00513]